MLKITFLMSFFNGLFTNFTHIKIQVNLVRVINTVILALNWIVAVLDAIKFSNEKASEFNQTYFTPFEWGVNFKSSFSYKKYVLYINYGRGISPRVLSKYAGNTSGNDFGKYEAGTKNQVLSIGFGYVFKTNSKKPSKVSCYNGNW